MPFVPGKIPSWDYSLVAYAASCVKPPLLCFCWCFGKFRPSTPSARSKVPTWEWHSAEFVLERGGRHLSVSSSYLSGLICTFCLKILAFLTFASILDPNPGESALIFKTFQNLYWCISSSLLQRGKKKGRKWVIGCGPFNSSDRKIKAFDYSACRQKRKKQVFLFPILFGLLKISQLWYSSLI